MQPDDEVVMRVLLQGEGTEDERAAVEGLVCALIDPWEGAPPEPAVTPPHLTCVDVTTYGQRPGSAWVCGADCPDCHPLQETYPGSGVWE